MHVGSRPPVVRAADLVPEAATFVYTHFKENLPEDILFHGYAHTVDVVEAAAKIAARSDVDRDEQAVIVLAAWFHDVGYTDTYDGHEEASVKRATAFLKERGASSEVVQRVAALIRATHPGFVPRTLSEKVIRDADRVHIGRKNFFARTERLRLEWARTGRGEYSDQEWLELQQRFLAETRFETPFARKQYGDRREKNLRDVRRQLARQLDEERPVPTTRTQEPSRGIETMFRTNYRNHINLSAIADSKANIMISVNAILMSIIVSFVSTRPDTRLWLLVPAASMLVSSLVATVFAILSARPKVTSTTYSPSDVRRNRANILFFGNFTRMPLDEYTMGMHEIMGDWEMLYDSMINDIYSLGQVLAKKYRLLWISYTVFMAGLVLSVALFLLFFFVLTNVGATAGV